MPTVATRSRPKVFLTSSSLDAELAARVAAMLDASGVEVIGGRNTHRTTAQAGADLRDAINRSRAVVVVLSRSTTSDRIPPSVLFEVGAATGAHKPVFVILEDSSYRLEFGVPDMHVLPVSRADEVGQALADLGG